MFAFMNLRGDLGFNCALCKEPRATGANPIRTIIGVRINWRRTHDHIVKTFRVSRPTKKDSLPFIPVALEIAEGLHLTGFNEL